jgi:hypothetical protein
MNKEWRQFWKWMPCGILGVALTSAVAAAPPPNRGEFLSRSAGDAATGRLGGDRASIDRPALSRLDLRAPADLPAFDTSRAQSLAVGSPAFPSIRPASTDLTRTSEAATTRAKLEESLAPVGGDARPNGRVQEMAQRFRHEGLPVARLFENRSALVSLGLNQRGKPGLWLIQKIP